MVMLFRFVCTDVFFYNRILCRILALGASMSAFRNLLFTVVMY